MESTEEGWVSTLSSDTGGGVGRGGVMKCAVVVKTTLHLGYNTSSVLCVCYILCVLTMFSISMTSSSVHIKHVSCLVLVWLARPFQYASVAW